MTTPPKKVPPKKVLSTVTKRRLAAAKAGDIFVTWSYRKRRGMSESAAELAQQLGYLTFKENDGAYRKKWVRTDKALTVRTVIRTTLGPAQRERLVHVALRHLRNLVETVSAQLHKDGTVTINCSTSDQKLIERKHLTTAWQGKPPAPGDFGHLVLMVSGPYKAAVYKEAAQELIRKRALSRPTLLLRELESQVLKATGRIQNFMDGFRTYVPTQVYDTGLLLSEIGVLEQKAKAMVRARRDLEKECAALKITDAEVDTLLVTRAMGVEFE